MKSVAQVLYRRLRATSALVSFSPSSLFASGEQGVWLDNSDFTTLFQDAAGTTPVTGYEQFVGLRLDKSKSGVGTNGAKRVNLLTRTEEFDNAAWTKINSTIIATNGVSPTGTATADTVQFTVGIYGSVFQTTSVVSGASYKLSVYAKAGTLDTLGLEFRGVGSVPDVIFNLTSGTVISGSGGTITSAGDGWFLCTVTKTSVDTSELVIISAGASPASNGTLLLWGADLRLASEAATLPTYQRITDTWYNTIPGNHAYQTTTTARAVLSARYNLLTYTEQFDNAAWSLGLLLAFGSGSTVNATTAPNGTTTADLITPNTTFAPHSIWQAAATVANGVSYTATWHVKPNGYTKMAIVENEVTGYYTAYDASGSGSMLSQSNATGTITALADGWYRITHTSVSSGTLFRPQLFILRADYTFGSVTSSWTPNGTSGLYIWGADLRATSESSALPAYQRVGAAVNGTSTSIGTPDYDTVGFPAYLRYDGGDWYQTNSINFSTGATNPPALGPNLNPGFAAYSVVLTGTWSASGSNYVFTDTVGGQQRPGVSWPISTLPVGTYKLDVVVASITGATQIRMDGVGAADILLGVGTTSRIVTVTTLSTPRLRIEDTSTTIGDGFAITSVSIVAVDANYAPDKMSVFAGVRKLSDAADAILVELSASVSTNNGSFALLAPYSSTANVLGFALRGDTARTNQIVGSSPYAAPDTLVMSVSYDTSKSSSAAEILPRVNGLVPFLTTAGAADSGAGNFGNYPLYIGARAGTSTFYTGREYSTIVLGRAVTATELANTEGYMETQTFGKDMAYVYSDELTTATGDLITAADGDQIYMTVQYV